MDLPVLCKTFKYRYMFFGAHTVCTVYSSVSLNVHVFVVVNLVVNDFYNGTFWIFQMYFDEVPCSSLIMNQKPKIYIAEIIKTLKLTTKSDG